MDLASEVQRKLSDTRQRVLQGEYEGGLLWAEHRVIDGATADMSRSRPLATI
jgi:hypothetical protein